MYVCIHIHTHVCMHTHTHTHTHTHMYACIHTHTCMHAYTHTCTHTHTLSGPPFHSSRQPFLFPVHLLSHCMCICCITPWTGDILLLHGGQTWPPVIVYWLSWQERRMFIDVYRRMEARRGPYHDVINMWKLVMYTTSMYKQFFSNIGDTFAIYSSFSGCLLGRMGWGWFKIATRIAITRLIHNQRWIFFSGL